MPALAYLLTFNTYGTRSHGDQRGSVDRKNNVLGEPHIGINPDLERRRRELMRQEPYVLDKARQQFVLHAIRQHAAHRKWIVWAVHVHTAHVQRG